MAEKDRNLSLDPTLDLRVSSYDRVSSSLISALLFVGFMVLMMALIWLTRQTITTQKVVAVELLEEASGRGGNAAGYARELEEPGLDEVDEQLEPQLQEMIAVLEDVILADAAALETLSGDAATTGHGHGAGDSRQAGGEVEGRDIIPRWERWEILFSSSSPLVYAKQLDAFKIELGAVGGGRKEIDYASDLAQSSPTVRQGSGDNETRLYMTWRSGALKESDQNLLNKAGIPTSGRIVMQFYSSELENRLALIERDASGGRNVEEIQKTVFGVTQANGVYAFVVVNQTFRNIQ
jgi:hypothetical protein